MASTVPGGYTLIISGQCGHRDHICLVGFPTLCSRLSDGMGLASVSFAPRIKFFLERSENLKNKWGAFWAPIQIARAIIVENAQSMPIKMIGWCDGRAVRPCWHLDVIRGRFFDFCPALTPFTHIHGWQSVCVGGPKITSKSQNPSYPSDILRFICNGMEPIR